ncbi:MAG: hypothetical protein QOG15_1629 [Solirubrobacteraceae bacterium]|nr:hypothetical protein [Solirubrobacteraceae bacterium]
MDWVQGRTPRLREEAERSPAPAELPDVYAYLLGLYLGDGCVSKHHRGVFKLRIALDAKYPEIVAECARAMTAVMPGNSVGTRLSETNYVEVYGYSKRWPAYFPQHGTGMKHLRPIVLQPWQLEVVARTPQLLLRGLIHSDGCRFINTGRGNWTNPRYSFSNRSDDIRRIFCDACDLVGARWTTAPYTVYVSRKADVAELDRFIGPKT